MLVELAQRANINKGTLSAIEHGRRFPTDSEAEKIAAAYGQPLDFWYPTHVVVELHADPSKATA